MTALKTEEAAMEAERTTALSHIADLRQLQGDMEGDREKKVALMAAIEEENTRLAGEIESLRQRQADNDAESAQLNGQLQQVLDSRAQAEAAKTRGGAGMPRTRARTS